MAQRHGHEVRLVPAAYVKPFVKRQKNDKADAEAIAEAALRPTVRFVAVKSAETQGRGRIPDPSMFCAATYAAHQRASRTSAEFGLVAPKGPASLKVLENEATDLPRPVRE